MLTKPDLILEENPLAFLQGGGDMGELIRSRDWQQSELGPPEQWPVALKLGISTVLNCGTAMHIAWGDSLLQFYNDAYTPVLTDGKHPAALGRGCRETFPEIWAFVEPLFDRVLNKGETVAMENASLMMYRDGVLTESIFTFSYNPIKSLAGEICGVMSVCWETTEEVLIKRRERGLRLLSEQVAAATTLEEVRHALHSLFEGCRADLPFVLWYDCDEVSRTLHLVQSCGISPKAPLIRELGAQDGGSKLGQAIDSRVPVSNVLRLPEPATDWLLNPPPAMKVECIAIEPLCFVDYSTPDAYLVFGVGAQRPFDGATKNFIESICHGVERAIRRISAVDCERRESLRQFEAVTEVVPSMVWMTDAEGACTFVSSRWRDFTGRTEAGSLGLGWMTGLHPDDHERVAVALRAALASREPIDILYRFQRTDGDYRWMMNQGVPRHDEHGNFLGMVGSSLDVTERKALEDELVLLAAEDPLTGLPNRRHFHERLLKMCQDASGDVTPVGLIFIDLDQFKTVNDSLTHAAGDMVLQEVATRLRSAVDQAGLVSRMGGDEFAIALPGWSREQADVVAKSIAEAVAQPFIVHSMEVFLTASLGVATAPGDAVTADDLIGCADLAMYEVKRSGRNGIAHYLPNMRIAPASILSLRGRMSRGMERDEYFVLFQPIASVSQRSIVAAEALLRWNPLTGEVIGPATFIPVAEETGLIVPLSERMMTLAFSQAASWGQQGHQLLISVNVSARQLREPDICRRIHALTTEHGLASEMVQLEITESVLMEHLEQSERQLLELTEMGFRIALDDFGTGYSSLAYLKSFPIDSIKIDGSFIRGLTNDPRDGAIVRTIINMSRDLGITTVAEGVETEVELEMIANLGCDYYQGYLLARPLPGDELAGLLHK